MVTAALDKRLLRLIKATRGQFLAAVLIITIGIFTYTALTNAGINLDQTLEDYYSDTHFADVFITTAPIAQSQADRLSHDPQVEAAESRLRLDAPLLTEMCIRDRRKAILLIMIRQCRLMMRQRDLLLPQRKTAAQDQHTGQYDCQ